MTHLKTLSNLFMALFILVLVGLVGSIGYYSLLYTMRKKLATGMHALLLSYGIDMSEEYLYQQFNRMTYRELSIVIRFHNAWEKKDYATMFALYPQIQEVLLTKTDLGLITAALSTKI